MNGTCAIFCHTGVKRLNSGMDVLSMAWQAIECVNWPSLKLLKWSERQQASCPVTFAFSMLTLLGLKRFGSEMCSRINITASICKSLSVF